MKANWNLSRPWEMHTRRLDWRVRGTGEPITYWPAVKQLMNGSRIRMCEVAVDQGSWIMVDPWEAVHPECS
jgi:hypothetical protein